MGNKKIWISAVVILALFPGYSLSQETPPSVLHQTQSPNIGRWHLIGSLKELKAYIDMNDIGCKRGDFVVTVLEDYQENSSSETKSSEVFYLVNTKQNIYFGIHGFDYTEHMGQGRRMHFEFNTDYARLRESFNHRESWQKASIENVGGAIIGFLKKSGDICTIGSNDVNSKEDHRTLPLDMH